jgi:hypothetical protein
MGDCKQGVHLSEATDLERHLAGWAAQDRRYNYIHARWITAKERYTPLLAATTHAYPGYSLHDASHSVAIISAIEKLLGHERIALLSPTDTWLLLECAYAHDRGMVKSAEELFGDWLNDAETLNHWIQNDVSKDRNLWSQLEFIYPLLKRLADQRGSKLDIPYFIRYSEQDSDQLFTLYDNERPNWPIMLRNALSSLAQAYHRSNHAKDSADMLLRDADRPHALIDIYHDPIIEPRLLRLIPEIAAFHGKKREDLFEKFEQVTLGVGNDDAHPRFVAELIRVGDLLDLDTNRFNGYITEVTGNVDRSSLVHKIKHSGIVSLDIRPERIYVGARYSKSLVQRVKRAVLPPNSHDAIYSDAQLLTDGIKAMLAWLKWLKQEIEFFTVNWHSIVPDGFSGAAPAFDNRVFREAQATTLDEIDLRYEINTRRAAELIEGTNMYRNPGLVFLRETVQNAVDISKRQLFYDIRSGHFEPLLVTKEGMQWRDCCPRDLVHPFEFLFHIEKAIKRYAIEVDVKRSGPPAKPACRDAIKESCKPSFPAKQESIVISIRDHGTGISIKKLEDMRYVGNIFDREFLKIYTLMPAWFRPTGSFGYGMQSIFRNVRSFCIKTAQIDALGFCKGFQATFYSSRMGGEIYSEPMSQDEAIQFGRGAEIIVELEPSEAGIFLRNARRDTTSPDGTFDVYGDKLAQIQQEVERYLDYHCAYNGFPIRKLWQKEKSLDTYQEDMLQLFGDYMFIRPIADIHNHKESELIDIRKKLGLASDMQGTNVKPALAFSVWDQASNVLMRYALPHSRDSSGEMTQEITEESSRVRIYFKGILVEDPKKEHSRLVDRIVSDSIAIPNWQGRESLWAIDAHIMGYDTAAYIPISRDRFLPEKAREVISTLQGITLWTLQKMMHLVHSAYLEDAAQTQTDDIVSCFIAKFIADEVHVKELLSAVHFMLPEDLTEREKLLLQMDIGNGSAYRFTKITKEPLLEMPTALNPWCVDRSDYIWGEIHDLDECSIPKDRSLLAVRDIWARYHAYIAMDSIYLYLPQPVSYEYQRIYHLSLRNRVKHEGIQMDDADYWVYAKQVAGNTQDARILLPGHPSYKVLSVHTIRDELYNEENQQFPNWIIIPISSKTIHEWGIALKASIADLDRIKAEIEQALCSYQNAELYKWVANHSVDTVMGRDDATKHLVVRDMYKDFMNRFVEKTMC